MIFWISLAVKIYLIGSLLAIVYNYRMKDKGADGIPWIQCMNPLKHLSVLVGFTFSLIPQHVFEQLVMRVYDDYCRPNCLLANGGKCDSCGCHAYQKMMSPFEKDSRGNWDKIVWSKKKYKKHREEYPIKIEVKWI